MPQALLLISLGVGLAVAYMRLTGTAPARVPDPDVFAHLIPRAGVEDVITYTTSGRYAIHSRQYPQQLEAVILDRNFHDREVPAQWYTWHGVEFPDGAPGKLMARSARRKQVLRIEQRRAAGSGA